MLALKVGNLSTFNSGNTYALQLSHNNRYLLALNYNNTSYYPWLVNDTWNGYEALIFHFNGIGDQFYFNRTGQMLANGDMRAPIFYDSDNTTFRIDGNGTSKLSTLNVDNLNTGNYINIGYTNNSESVSTSSFRGIDWHTTGDPNYYIGKPAGAWTQPLNIRFYTGIRLQSHQSYGGTQFLNISSGTTVMAVNNGDDYVHVYTRMYAPIYYDENNAGYYLDPASTSNLNEVYSYSYRGNGNVGGTGNASWHPNGIYSAGYNWLYGGINMNGGQLDGVGAIYATIYYDRNDSAYYVDPAGGNARIGRDLYVSGYAGGSTGNRLIVGDTSTPYSLLDGNLRPMVYIRGQYPVLTLDHTVTSNTNHGPTIQFSHNGLNNRQWVIGTTGDGISMDIGFSNTSQGNTSHNPHHGIAGYVGTTFMRFRENGNMGLGSAGDWGAIGGGEPGYALDTRGHLYNNTRVDAPIFYDANNTAYYVDPASFTELYGGIRNSGAHGSSQIINRLLAGNNGAGTGIVQLQMWCSEPGVTWDWAGFGYNVTNDGGTPSGFGRINTSFGQAYMRFSTSGNTYFYNTNTSGTRYNTMEWYSDSTVYANNYLTGGNSLRAPIFYDSNNTAYYVDPAGTARLSYVAANAGIRIDGNEDLYLDYNYGCSIVGVYASTRYQGVFSMGNAYKLSRDGTTAGNLYGLAWSHPNTGGVASNLNTHGLLALENGAWLASLTGSTRARDDMRAPLFYDNNNTAYYIDPNSNSVMLNMFANRHFTQYNNFGDLVNNAPWYGLGGSDVGGPFGGYLVQLGGYFGLRLRTANLIFELDSPSYSSGWGYLNGPFAFNSQIRAHQFYDYNDTGYYLDPNGDRTSNINGWNTTTQARTGITFKYNNWRPYITGDTNYWTGQMGWGTTDMNTVMTWGSGFIDSWSNPANQPSGTSHWVGVQTYHYTNAYNSGYGWQLVGGPISNLRFRNSWPNNSGWTTVAMHDRNDGSGGALYAGIYYDANNTGYYSDQASTSNYNAIVCISFTETSSIRYKENVVELDNSLDKVLSMRGVSYNRKGSDDTEIGVIAEEVADIVPEIIKFTKSGEADSVSYGRITALLIEAIKEQQQQINELKALLSK